MITERDAGYLQALADVQNEVRKTGQDPTTSRDGRLELLSVLSFLSALVGVTVRAYHGDVTVSEKTQGRRERERKRRRAALA